MFDKPEVIQEELAELIESLRDTAVVLHGHEAPRFLHQNKFLDMKFWNQNNYIDMFYSLVDLVPGNEFKWMEQPNAKVTLEFTDDMWISASIHVKYDETNFRKLTKFLAEKQLELVIPGAKMVTKKDEDGNEYEEEYQHSMGSNTGQNYFLVNGLFLYDLETVKDFILEVDNAMNEYILEVS